MMLSMGDVFMLKPRRSHERHRFTSLIFKEEMATGGFSGSLFVL